RPAIGTSDAAFYLRLAEHPFERGRLAADAGLWPEAEAAFAELRRQLPDDQPMWTRHIQLLWAVGRRSEARAEFNRMFQEYVATHEPYSALELMRVAAMFPEPRDAYTRMALLIESRILLTSADRAQWILCDTGLAFLSAGKWDKAIQLL